MKGQVDLVISNGIIGSFVQMYVVVGTKEGHGKKGNLEI